MTRMQKWQSYRDEIAKQALVGKSIAADEINLQKYKEEIDKINPAILSSSVEENPSLLKGVSNVEITQTQISTKIADMFATINKAANTINQDTVESIFYNLKNDKLVDKSGKFDDEKLKNTCREYKWFKDQTNIPDFHSASTSEKIKQELKDKYTNFSSPNQNKQKVEPVFIINKNSEKQASHYVFVISISVSLLLLAIVLSLFITKVVLR